MKLSTWLQHGSSCYKSSSSSTASSISSGQPVMTRTAFANHMAPAITPLALGEVADGAPVPVNVSVAPSLYTCVISCVSLYPRVIDLHQYVSAISAFLSVYTLWSQIEHIS